MTPEAQRIAIAQECDWYDLVPNVNGREVWGNRFGDTKRQLIPDYLNDLNAMAEAEETLRDVKDGQIITPQRYKFSKILFELTGGSSGPDGEDEGSEMKFELCHATAPQRAEAFLKTIGKWVEAGVAKRLEE